MQQKTHANSTSSRSPTAQSGTQVAVWAVLALGVPLMLVVPLCLFLSQLGSAQRQHRINTSYLPVKATIVSARVTSSEDSHHNVDYVPAVEYRYEVNGKSYLGNRLAPWSSDGSQAWADRVVAKCKPGSVLTAYYDPDDPGQAVLLKGYDFEPYFSMLEMAFVLTGASFMLLSVWFSRKRPPVPADRGWFELKPESGERARLFTAKVCTAIWYGFGAVPMIHYFLCLPPPHAARSLATFLGYALLGLIPLGLMIRYLIMCRNTDEARLLVDQPTALLGRRFKFVLTQRARRQLQLKLVRVRLLCIGTKAKGRSRIRRVLHEATAVELSNHNVHAGEDLELSGELTPPADLRPTGRDATGQMDWINWKLDLECKVERAPDYDVSFPLTVQAAPLEEPEPTAGAEPRARVEVRPVDPAFAGRILSKSNLLMANLIGLVTLLLMFVGIAMMVSVFLVIFPDKHDTKPFWNLPRPQAIEVFAGGAVLTGLTAVQGILFPGMFSGRYIRWVAGQTIRRRRDAIVQPGADSLFVEIIPRANWNRMMLENATDIGFLKVDVPGREIRFEGDKERYRIAAAALKSCELEKSLLTSTARPNAPGFWLVVIRAFSESGIWEAPVAPRLNTSVLFSTKLRKRAAEALQSKIKALLPGG